MLIDVKIPTQKNVKYLRMYLKIRDEMSFTLHDENNVQLGEYEGYVPNDIIPGEFGDYMDLKIDLDTGQIVNWFKPSSSALAAIINGEEID